MPEADVVLEAAAERRGEAALEQIAEAYEARTTVRPGPAGTQPRRTAVPPERLYLVARTGRRASPPAR